MPKNKDAFAPLEQFPNEEEAAVASLVDSPVFQVALNTALTRFRRDILKAAIETEFDGKKEYESELDKSQNSAAKLITNLIKEYIE